MNVDSFFTIGTTHKVCQDYVLHGNVNGNPYVILSDGCSTAVDSDFGSRLLCKSCEPLIYAPDYNINSMLDGITRNAHTFSRALNLEDDSLCATLVFAKIEEEKFRVFSVGDCVIGAKKKDGTLEIVEYEFVSGAPYYLRYEIQNVKKGYFEQFGKKVVRKSYWIKGSEISTVEIRSFDLDQIFFAEEFPCEQYEFVAVMSDGARSFLKTVTTNTTKQNIAVGPLQTLKELLAFKGYFGEFVNRRCQKAFKQFKEQGIFNYDDFSLGVISSKDGIGEAI